jgi:alpha,alpha-trehalase
LSDFNALNSSGTITEGAIVDFVDSDFRGEGLELEALVLANFNPTPAFLGNVLDPLLKAWSQTVHSYWAQLIRGTNASTLCAEGTSTTCESSLIPLNHTFVVPGGRFREQCRYFVNYENTPKKLKRVHPDYWDTYWIIEGLLESELFTIANASLQNFMDEIETLGFIPNGGRIYCRNVLTGYWRRT